VRLAGARIVFIAQLGIQNLEFRIREQNSKSQIRNS